MEGLTPQAFAKKWAGTTLSERASYQQHFLDLCAMLGQPAPAEADPGGSFYAFEKGVEKTGGGKGFADVWYRDRFAFEYKGGHKDLTAAYGQLLQYRESLGNPPILVVTDTDRYEVHTNFDRTVERVYRFTNAELPRPENLRVLRALFEDPDALRPTRTVEGVTEEAARRFARLADGLRARGVEPHEAAHFLNKLLFCLFAEDIGLLPKGLFTRVVERTARDPSRFATYIGNLFAAMRDGGDFLYVSLKELLDLEKEVSTFAGEIGLTPFFPGVNPEQLHGIETSPYAHELAQVAVWIGYL